MRRTVLISVCLALGLSLAAPASGEDLFGGSRLERQSGGDFIIRDKYGLRKGYLDKQPNGDFVVRNKRRLRTGIWLDKQRNGEYVIRDKKYRRLGTIERD